MLYEKIKYFEDLFYVGMDRHLNYVLPDVTQGCILNLGAGSKMIVGALDYDHPDYDFDETGIPHEDESVDQIHAYHFLEHLEDPVRMLLEIQRVLKPRGHVNIVVPYYSAQIACQDLDHKKFFTEETWKTLFKNQYYNKNRIEWKFEIYFNMIAGIAERNLCLFTQLRKIT